MLKVMDSNQKMKSIRFKEAFDYLKKKGIISSQKDLAEKIRVTPETITRVLKCQGKNPTDNFIEKFARTFRDEFNESYLLSGIGCLLKNDPVAGSDNDEKTHSFIIEKQFVQLENKDKTISFLQQEILTRDEEIQRLLAVIEKFSPANNPESKDKKIGNA